MHFDAKFNLTEQSFPSTFGKVHNVSDGGYERGYDAGYKKGYAEGEAAGYAQGEAHGRAEGEAAGYAQGEAHGRAEGYAQGKTDGHAEGYAKGYADGYAAGYEAGQEAGYNKGHAEGYTEGEIVGYEAGYADGKIPVVEKDVNFYNYDGRLLHSYTLEEIQALTELPPAPPMGRDFLSFEEWNWSLEDIKALNLPLCVTATVCPTDGNTKAVLEILDSRVATVTMFIRQVSGVLSVDWGDGSESTTFAAAINVNRTLEHTYAEVGEYIVTISTDGGCFLGHGGTTTSFLCGRSQVLTEVYLGRNANLNQYGLLAHKCLIIVAFPLGTTEIYGSACWQSNCIKSVSFPSTLKVIGQRAFNANYRLSVLSLPASLEQLGYVPFTDANGLHSITIPSKCSENGARYTSIPQIYIAEGVKNISGEFAYDGVIRSIVIPSTVETISAQAFRGCNQLERMVFKPLVPPAVANENALAFAKMCIVEVPAESLEAYQNATNYGTIAAQMVGV